MTWPMRSSSPMEMISAFMSLCLRMISWSALEGFQRHGSLEKEIGVESRDDIIKHDALAAAHGAESAGREGLEKVEDAENKKSHDGNKDRLWEEDEGDPHPEDFIDGNLARIVAVDLFHGT